MGRLHGCAYLSHSRKQGSTVSCPFLLQNPVPSILLSDEPWSTPRSCHLWPEDNDAGSHCASRPWDPRDEAFFPARDRERVGQGFKQTLTLPPVEWMYGGVWKRERGCLEGSAKRSIQSGT